MVPIVGELCVVHCGWKSFPSWMPMKEGKVRNLKRKDVKIFDRCTKLSIQDFQCF
jgi:hypothetical protein